MERTSEPEMSENIEAELDEDEQLQSLTIEKLPLLETPVIENVVNPLEPVPANSIKSISEKPIKSIKRTRNPENWKVTVRKRLRQSGKEYTNAKGIVMSPRQVRPGCGDTCYHKCIERFSDDQRQFIHNVFWRLTDEQKNYYYWKYTSRIEPKRRRTQNKNNLRRYTFHYYFEVKGAMMQVCSKFFYATLDITSKRIYNFYENCYQEDTCMPRQDCQVRTRNRKPIVQDLGERLDIIRQHIASFPSARLGGSSQKRYLAADLNITKMYKMYAEGISDPLKHHWYSRIFNEEYNLGFRLPVKSKKKSETCSSSVEKKARKPAACISKPIESKVEIISITTTHIPTNPVPTAEQKLQQPQISQPTAIAGTSLMPPQQQQQWNSCLQAAQTQYPTYSWSGF